MKIPSKNKIAALIISAILVILIATIVAPSFSAEDVEQQNIGYGCGYGYGYGYDGCGYETCARTQGDCDVLGIIFSL